MYVRRNEERSGETGGESEKGERDELVDAKVRKDLMQFRRAQTNDEEFRRNAF